MGSIRKKVGVLISLLLLGSLASTLAACNTTEGAGKDIKSLGSGIEDAASDAKN